MAGALDPSVMSQWAAPSPMLVAVPYLEVNWDMGWGCSCLSGRYCNREVTLPYCGDGCANLPCDMKFTSHLAWATCLGWP